MAIHSIMLGSKFETDPSQSSIINTLLALA